MILIKPHNFNLQKEKSNSKLTMDNKTLLGTLSITLGQISSSSLYFGKHMERLTNIRPYQSRKYIIIYNKWEE